jgi:peptidoglycan/LPS O-acetylase OafA/YrhL
VDPAPTHRYFPALDGLRAISVVIVLLFHHGLLAAGWVGVDVFFALSGFLITGILRSSASTATFWSSFYVKRVTRIVPPVLLLLVLVALLRQTLAPAYLAYLFFGGNVIELSSVAIWQLSPLWSLAIEEHFYLAWPLAIRCLSRRILIRLTLALLLAEPILRALATLALRHYIGPQLRWNNPIFLLTPFRLDGLLAGGLLAFLIEDHGLSRVSNILKRFSLPTSAILFAFFLALEAIIPTFRRSTDSLPFNTFAYTLTAVASATLIAHLVLNPNASLSSLLSRRPFVLLGRISYGLYLFQSPVKAFLNIHLPHTPDGQLFPLTLAATTALATFSFLCYEKPCIAAGRRMAARINAQSSDPVPRIPSPSLVQ